MSSTAFRQGQNRSAKSLRSSDLQLNTLDTRDLPAPLVFGAASPFSASSQSTFNAPALGAIVSETIAVYQDGATLYIRGTALDDRVEVANDSQVNTTNSKQGTQRLDFTFGSVNRIEFDGFGGQDTFINNGSIVSFARGGEGNDTLIGGTNGDTLVGGNHFDTIDGRAGNDIIWGDGIGQFSPPPGEIVGNGSDTLDGGDGNDIVSGGYGNDTVRGGAGNDSLFGDSEQDFLDGQDGDDRLFGNDGNDVLFGGRGVNQLSGGTGIDRFLAWTGNGTSAAVNDLTNQDARVNFRDTAAHTTTYTGVGAVSFAAGAWTPDEILTVDVALGNLQNELRNTKFLKRADGGELNFSRDGQQLTFPGGFVVGGGNGGGNISLTQAAFSSTNSVLSVVYHEVGHNWDEAHENGLIGNFRAISGWVQSGSNPNPAVFTASTQSDDNWFYRSNQTATGFARDYGRFNPHEDYATTWETYFMQRYHGTTLGNRLVGAKAENVAQLANNLRT